MIKVKDNEITISMISNLQTKLMDQFRSHSDINSPEMLEISRKIDELINEIMKNRLANLNIVL